MSQKKEYCSIYAGRLVLKEREWVTVVLEERKGCGEDKCWKRGRVCEEGYG